MIKMQNLIYSRIFQQVRSGMLRGEKLPFASLVEQVRDEIDLKVVLSLRDREKIPAQGRLLIVANHPLAFLDLFALYTTIADVRKDVTAVVDTLQDFIAPGPGVIVRESGEAAVSTMRAIQKALQAEKAVILFPAHTRHWGISQITDGAWHKSIMKIATQWETPVLPAFIAARNRLSHYFWTAVGGLYSDMSLDCEITSQMKRQISVSISNPILPDSIRAVKAATAAKLMRKHVYLLGRGKQGIFRTSKNIVHPIDKKLIVRDIEAAEILGKTDDDIRILLVRHDSAPALMREIGRLRELTFRKVGEGTGRKIDLDDFDSYYLHIVLWDPAALEVVGAYRLAAGDELYGNRGTSGFYTSTLFRFSEGFEKYLPHSLELGRSFVQPDYWNSQALDYLWHGIGAFLAARPQYKYLFGPVSVSASYTAEARELLVYFYRKWFGAKDSPVRAKHRFVFHTGVEDKLAGLLRGDDYKQSFKELKQNLKHYGYAVPTLYKQYTELCESGGVRFLDFGIDKDFNNSLDGFIFLEIEKMKEAKLERYIYSKRPKAEWLAARSDNQVHLPATARPAATAEVLAPTGS